MSKFKYLVFIGNTKKNEVYYTTCNADELTDMVMALTNSKNHIVLNTLLLTNRKSYKKIMKEISKENKPKGMVFGKLNGKEVR